MVPSTALKLGGLKGTPSALSSDEICEYVLLMLKMFAEAWKIAWPPVGPGSKGSTPSGGCTLNLTALGGFDRRSLARVAAALSKKRPTPPLIIVFESFEGDQLNPALGAKLSASMPLYA